MIIIFNKNDLNICKTCGNELKTTQSKFCSQECSFVDYDKRHYNIEYNRKLKKEVFEHYKNNDYIGIYCNHEGCGADDLRGLQLHHINHDGKQHRKELNCTAGLQFMLRLRKLDYPNEEYPLEILWLEELVKLPWPYTLQSF